jgi:hypothetical protein
MLKSAAASTTALKGTPNFREQPRVANPSDWLADGFKSQVIPLSDSLPHNVINISCYGWRPYFGAFFSIVALEHTSC